MHSFLACSWHRSQQADAAYAWYANVCVKLIYSDLRWPYFYARIKAEIVRLYALWFSKLSVALAPLATGRQVMIETGKTQSHRAASVRLGTSRRLIRVLAWVQLIKHKLYPDLQTCFWGLNGARMRHEMSNIRNTRCGSTIVLSITSWATNIN